MTSGADRLRAALEANGVVAAPSSGGATPNKLTQPAPGASSSGLRQRASARRAGTDAIRGRELLKSFRQSLISLDISSRVFLMKLSDWAEDQGICLWTAWRWFHAGNLPGAVQMPSGTILVNVKEEPTRNLVGYARVSSSDQKPDLVRQADRLKVAGATSVVSEVGSGMNGKRLNLKKLLRSDDDIISALNTGTG